MAWFHYYSLDGREWGTYPILTFSDAPEMDTRPSRRWVQVALEMRLNIDEGRENCLLVLFVGRKDHSASQPTIR